MLIKRIFLLGKKDKIEMDEVITFDKTYQQRLEEYKSIFTTFSVYNRGSLTENWGTYVEQTLKRSEWMALWKISRTVCEHYEISYPTTVFVKILNVDYGSLEALVTIVAVQSDISLPAKHLVPLIELWPTKMQEKKGIQSMANTLDVLRFFYTKIFMPWDDDDGNLEKWIDKRLDSRLKLFYDMRLNNIPSKVCKMINNYIKEARTLKEQKELLEDEEELTSIHVQLLHIKTEFKLLEDPFTRTAFCNSDENELNKAVYVVHGESSLDNYLEFLRKIKQYLSHETVHLIPDINGALELCKPNDTIILNDSQHLIKDNFYFSGAIKGIPDAILLNENSYLLNIYKNVLLENLQLKTIKQNLLMIRQGVVTLRNCSLNSNENEGIILFPGCEVELINCIIINCSIGIVSNYKCTIKMKGCKINSAIGVKIFEDTSLAVEDCLFNCEYGITVEVERTSCLVQTTGGLDLLKKYFYV